MDNSKQQRTCFYEKDTFKQMWCAEMILKKNCSNCWTLFNKVKFVIISKHERYRTWKFIRWNTRFNRLTIFQLLEWTFPRQPDYNCRECCKLFQPKNKYLIQKGYFPIWECPHCSYPNDSADLGIISNKTDKEKGEAHE